MFDDFLRGSFHGQAAQFGRKNYRVDSVVELGEADSSVGIFGVMEVEEDEPSWQFYYDELVELKL